MALFQISVVNKYLSNLNSSLLQQAFQRFKQFYGDKERIENIKQLKEENYQEGFLREIFVEVLGYTINPDINYNLTTEFKNETDSKKADGAILSNASAIGVIELKSTKTTNLESITNQAFNYKNHQPNCRYVITSNFERLRFYIDNATEYEEFDLFNLTEKDFAKLYLLLSKESICSNIPSKLKEESKLHEENISDQLYKDYKEFKDQIFKSLVENNLTYNKILLFEKSQKLLDRILFILFAEDRGLIPPNAITRIVEQWKQLKELDEEKSLYSRFIKFFSHLNTGHKYKDFELPPYNGGLFKPDEVLDKVKIDDEVLHKGSLNLSTYDFNTEIDVNILGHIFEHSLSEIEEVTAQLEGTQTDKTKSRRKKEGVYYTPKYITKYIVDNTIGTLCKEKREVLGLVNIDEEIFENSRTVKGELNKKAKTLFENFKLYTEYLLTLKILDPACGSGAFLNQALEFLIKEHNRIAEQVALLLGQTLVVPDVGSEILENNLYGVDINEEAVEIAKLSLWLRTAQKGRKLSDLSQNIKCGNSLIDDPAVAGDKSFDWNKEFSDIMSNGGFDVVIGNPPYVNVELIPKDQKEYFGKKFSTFYKRSDLFTLFIEQSFSTITNHGEISFIIPSQILNNLSYKILREKLLKNSWLKEVCYVGNKIFADAVNDVVIIFLKLKNNKNIRLINALDFENKLSFEVDLDYFEKYSYIMSIPEKNENNSFFNKLFNESSEKMEDNFDVFQGIVTGNNPVYIFENNYEALEKGIEKELLKPCLLGRDFNKWAIDKRERRILYLNGDIDINNYPSTFNYLTNFKSELEKRRECIKGIIPWYSLQWPREKNKLDIIPKIVIQNTRNERLRIRIVAAVDELGFYGTQGLNFVVPLTNKFSVYAICAILNSKLINYLFQTKFLNLAIKAEYIKNIPIPILEEKVHISLDHTAKKMTSIFELIYKSVEIFSNILKSNFEGLNLSSSLQEFYNHDFKTFLKELNKQKIKLSLKQQDEWYKYFAEYKTKINELQREITKTDNEIDIMVYKLYNLTYDEVEIIDPQIGNIISKTDYEILHS